MTNKFDKYNQKFMDGGSRDVQIEQKRQYRHRVHLTKSEEIKQLKNRLLAVESELAASRMARQLCYNEISDNFIEMVEHAHDFYVDFKENGLDEQTMEIMFKTVFGTDAAELNGLIQNLSNGTEYRIHADYDW